MHNQADLNELLLNVKFVWQFSIEKICVLKIVCCLFLKNQTNYSKTLHLFFKDFLIYIIKWRKEN